MSNNSSPERKPFVQVPNSSPLADSSAEASPNKSLPPSRFNNIPIFRSQPNPAQPASSSNISMRLTTDLVMLKKKYPTLKEQVMVQTWKRKKGNLRQVIEFLNVLQTTHPQFFQEKPSLVQTNSILKSTTPAAESRLSKFPQFNAPNMVSRSAPQSTNQTLNLNPLRKKLSIQQKFGIDKSEPSVKKRRLVRGSRNPRPDYSEEMGDISDGETAATSADAAKSKKANDKPRKAKSKANLSDDDELSDSDLDDDDDDDDDMKLDSRDTSNNGIHGSYEYAFKVLAFLNSSSVHDICDIGQCQPQQAEIIISKRPFQTLFEIENLDFGESVERVGRRALKKSTGQKIVEKVVTNLKGYDAVESLVQQCSAYGKRIASEIAKWGVEVTGEAGELEMTQVKVDDDALVVKKGTYFTAKPKYLAPELELKPYQQVGINWLNLLYQHNLSCILADEMGLGKTCQIISFFAHLKEIGVDEGPHLVVVPSSTLENWLREFKKFCPILKVVPYYGSQSERADLRDDLSETDYDIMVTTYNLTTGHKDDMKFLRSQGFNVVVYDEGHMLKNSQSERYAKLMRLRANFRVLLTGTPLQNNLRELISLLAFILPELFVSKKDDLSVLFSQKVRTSNRDQGSNFNPLLAERAISKAKTMMAPFVLRRKKKQVLDNLPEKHTYLEYCELTEGQKRLYKEQIALGRSAKLDNGDSKSTNVIMKLRKAAIHPLLFRDMYNDAKLRVMAKEIMREPVYRDANEQFIFEDMQVMTDYELHKLCEKFASISHHKLKLDKEIWNSSKFLKLQQLLPKFIVQGDRILIFSLFTSVLDILEVLLNQLEIKYLRLDGSTSVELRQDIIDQFYKNEEIKVFILSTKAGGFGINLTCANTVVIFDQSFNPHDDRQAEDRAHRVGQKRPVNVYRLLSKDTIEENIYSMAQSKLELDQSVSGESESKMEMELMKEISGAKLKSENEDSGKD